MRGVWRVPVFDDPREQARARTFHTMMVTGVAVLAPLLVLSIALRPASLPNHAPYAAMLLLHVAHLALLRRAGLRVAVVSFATGYLAIAAMAMVISGGLRAPIGFVLPPLVLLVGLSLGGRAAIATALSASAVGLVMVVLEDVGLLLGSRAWRRRCACGR
jgi:hypothetical protein